MSIDALVSLSWNCSIASARRLTAQDAIEAPSTASQLRTRRASRLFDHMLRVLRDCKDETLLCTDEDGVDGDGADDNQGQPEAKEGR